jgi:flagellar hook-basal body complex protein FliE
MAVTGIHAYANAVRQFSKIDSDIRQQMEMPKPGKENSFSETLRTSLAEVNDMQTVKGKMIESFASGETQNVHELMISLQKAGLAINMTSAVRNKVLEAYKELTRLQF